MKKILNEWQKYLNEEGLQTESLTGFQGARRRKEYEAEMSPEQRAARRRGEWSGTKPPPEPEPEETIKTEWPPNPSLDGMKCEEFKKEMMELKHHAFKPGSHRRQETGTSVWYSLLDLNRLGKSRVSEGKQLELAKQFLEKKGPFANIPEEYLKAVEYEIGAAAETETPAAEPEKKSWLQRAKGAIGLEEQLGPPAEGSKVFDSDRALLDSVLKHPLARRALNCYMQTKQAAAPSPGSQEYFMSQMESRKLTKRGLKLLIREEISKELK